MSRTGFDVEKYQPLYTPIAIFLGGLSIAAAIFVTGGLNGSSNVAGEAVPTDSGEPQFATVSVDDDPVMGEADAPVTIIEFSDFECPYCKTFHDETLPQIKEVYIDTGKVKFVFRDLPLSFHDPAATKEALAANCARDQGGDTAYFMYHDEIFARTPGNGEGMKEADYKAAADKLNLDSSALLKCVKDAKFQEEIANDLVNAENYGAGGTPSFFIGRSDPSGSFEGQLVSGAQPFESFQQIIDALLE